MHVDYSFKNISKKLGFLYWISAYLTKWTHLTIYNTIILPHFHFCNSIIYLSNVTGIKRLQILQNRPIRIILTGNKYTSIDWMLIQLMWLPIDKLHIYTFLSQSFIFFLFPINTYFSLLLFDHVSMIVEMLYVKNNIRNIEVLFVSLGLHTLIVMYSLLFWYSA